MSDECKVTVDAGVCKMNTVIVAKMNDDGTMNLEVKSDCSYVTEMAKNIQTVDPFNIIMVSICETDIYKSANESIPHAACPVPCGLIKAIEVASGLGLKKSATIDVE